MGQKKPFIIRDRVTKEPLDIYYPGEDVNVGEDGAFVSLPDKLAEMQDDIEHAGQGGYAPPAGGIPKTDLAQSVQDSLDAADSAVQPGELATVAKTGSYNDLKNKPTIPDTSGLATKTELNAKQDALVAGNGIAIAQDGKTVSVDAEVVEPVTADGTFAIRIGNDIYTISLNHEHPQYQPLLTAGTNITITTDPQTGEVTISAAGGGGGSGISGITMNGTAVTVNNGVANLGTVLTQHQSLAGRVQSNDVVNIVKITQSAYDALSVKDSSTLYLITES